ncbi:MAG: nucleoside-diphosphate sugar epimerase/dehydratase [Bacteroidetes bacterium]|nr:nucleoside-diphosphate sugar epimerase/dehydratase [Bacteroidota bacterium]
MSSLEKLFLKLSFNHTPRGVVLLIDIFLCAFSYIFISFVVLDFSFEPYGVVWLIESLLAILTFRIVAFFLTRIYQSLVRYTGISDAIRILSAVFISSASLLAFDFILYYSSSDKQFYIPLSIIVLDFFICLLALSSFRLGYKLLYSYYRNSPSQPKQNIAIFGAGDSGVITKRSLDRGGRLAYKIVAFLDDDEKKSNKKVEGVIIYHSDPSTITELVQKYNIHILLIAIQNISPKRKREIIELCLKLKVDVKYVPRTERWINGELSLAQFQNVNIDDLLDRDEIVLDKKIIAREVNGRKVLITGASGSIGSEIARQLRFFHPAKIYLLDQAESPLYELELELRENLKYTNFEVVIADIRNEIRMEKVFAVFKPDMVFHAAAYKHVPLMENNPSEAINTNVLGTKIVADLSVRYGVEKFVLVSTDKAVNPTNVMGCSKRIAEIYIQSLNGFLYNTSGTKYTQFVTTRFGNVLGSNGSVIPVFQKQIKNGGPLTITHPDVTRYFMTIPEACQLVLEAGAIGKGGEILIFDMGDSVRILDLAKKMIILAGLELGKDIQIVFSGLRPGEKIKEELLNIREKTIPTHHPKILIAQVQRYKYEHAYRELEELIKLFETQDNESIVAKMKIIVPEFISNNSSFESLDTIVNS